MYRSTWSGILAGVLIMAAILQPYGRVYSLIFVVLAFLIAAAGPFVQWLRQSKQLGQWDRDSEHFRSALWYIVLLVIIMGAYGIFQMM